MAGMGEAATTAEAFVNLAAIMFTDVVGYTSLTERNETRALALLEEHRRMIRPILSSRNGREVKTIGDAFLVEFPSATEAARCASEIQETLYRLNRARSPEERIFLRIGIHLGDVVHSHNDIFGDAVNIASRIQPLAEPEGVCITRQVYESVRSKMKDFSFESLGVRELKNVENPIEIFKVIMPWNDSPPSYSSDPSLPRERIAVLPFVNISSDPSDEFFADGLTEELIAHLSHSKDLRVIARTSIMNYKKKEKKIKEIGRELGVGTIIEGSVRKAGNRIRVTVQAVNAGNEEHLWSSTYDRNLDDIFEIQSDIATKVADSISSSLAALVLKQVQSAQERDETENVTAYTYFLHGRHLLHVGNEASVKQALEFFTQAIEEDPTFAKAYVGRAESYLHLSGLALIPFIEAAKNAEADIAGALEIDHDLASAHTVLSRIRYALDDFKAAEVEARKAIELNPSQADAYHALAHLKSIQGDVAESTRLFETSYRLDPMEEENIEMLGKMYLYGGRDEDAAELWKKSENLFPLMCCGGMFNYYLIKRDYSKAGETLERFRSFAGSDSVMVLSMEGMLAAYKGEKDKALDYLAQIESSMGEGTVALNSIGLIYYALGDYDRFFAYMNRALEIHALPLDLLLNSPLYAEARSDPRFQKLLEKLPLGTQPKK